MKITYSVTGRGRKSLVGAISQDLNAPTKYLGAPTFAYEVGGYTIDKTGTVAGVDNRELVADLQGLHGFKAVSKEYDAPLPEAEKAPAFENLRMTEEEELGLGRACCEDSQGENGMRAGDVPEPDRLVVQMPLTGFTPEKLDNLCKLVTAKAPLIKAAIGADDLPIKQTAETLDFPWFRFTEDGDTAGAYATLVSLLCKTAKEKKRVTVKEKPIEGSSRYAFRCFLLSLGFIGGEYKTARKILLNGGGLSGSSSRKSKDDADGGNGDEQE